jgi:hypothetical protein
MRERICCFLLTGFAVLGCGSPEKYQKQQPEVVAGTPESPGMSVGLELAPEYRAWAKGYIDALNDSRSMYAEGDSTLALRILDSLIAGGERSLDTLPFEDDRSKFVVLMLSDVYTQAIMWRAGQGDTTGARIRTERFQDLGDRIHRLRDSIDQLQ